MDALARVLSLIFIYFCVATLLTVGGGLGYLWATGKITGDKAFKILAVIHNVELVDPEADQKLVAKETPEEMSYLDLEKLREIRSRDLELKIVAMNKGIEDLRWRRQQLAEEKTRHERIKNAFDTKLAELSGESTRQGFANNRQLWETIPPSLVKQQIMAMVEKNEIDDVVVILADMPNVKKGKIVTTFKAPDEVEVMDEILRKIRKGFPTKPIIDQASAELRSAPAATP